MNLIIPRLSKSWYLLFMLCWLFVSSSSSIWGTEEGWSLGFILYEPGVFIRGQSFCLSINKSPQKTTRYSWTSSYCILEVIICPTQVTDIFQINFQLNISSKKQQNIRFEHLNIVAVLTPWNEYNCLNNRFINLKWNKKGIGIIVREK